MRILRCLLAVAAILAVTAFAICAVEATMFLRDLRDSLDDQVKALDVEKINATIADLDRTVRIAGGVLNEARDIERDNRKDLQSVNRETLRTMQNVNALLVSVDGSQKQAVLSIAQTSQAIIPVLDQTRRDLAGVEPAIRQVTPLLLRTTDIAVNVSNATADVAHEIHKFVYPPPRKWYQKYLLDPLKIATRMVTIPLR